MHQDQRIGLALGVLLVGACAAFFFRNETRVVPPALRVQHAEELDEKIAERTTRPYLKGIEAVEASDRRRRQSSDPSHGGDDSPDSASYWSPLNSTNDGQTRSTPTHDHQLRPKALSGDEVVEFAPITVPNELRDASEPMPSASSGASLMASGRDQGTNEGRTHVVQKGETLSSIAAKTLGSSSRFHELFEANLDQLNDPNSLKLGMILRIPALHSETAASPQVVKARHPPQLRSVPESESLEAGEAPVPLPTRATEEPVEITPRIDETPLALPSDSLTLPSDSESRSISIPIPPELPHDSAIDPSTETESPDDSNGSSKKFVPSRRAPHPGRPIGLQSKAANQRDGGVRRLSQVPPDALSGRIAR